jgi:hypothetical protein
MDSDKSNSEDDSFTDEKPRAYKRINRICDDDDDEVDAQCNKRVD